MQNSLTSGRERSAAATSASTWALLVTPLLLLALAASVQAEPLFSAPSLLFGTGNNPTSAAIADLNGDGLPDLAVTNSGAYSNASPTVSVLLGNGDGSFAARTNYAVGNGPGAVVIEDLNADGRLDLVVPVNFGSYPDYIGAVSVLLGNGDGTFRARSDMVVGPYLAAVEIADFNADGRLDLVVPHRFSNTVSVLLGNGDGTFGAGTQFEAGYSPATVAIGDLNGDGRLDLVTNGGYDPDTDDYLGVGSVLLGNGDGTFGAPIGFVTGYNPNSIAIADFSGDSRPDLVVANHGHTPDYFGTVSVLLGNGDGTFGAQRLYDTGVGPSSVAVADLNRDGRPDFATANFADDPDWASNTVSVFLGNGDGTFSGAPELNVGENPVSLAIADLDGNGTPDLVTPSVTSNTISVLLGNGDGSFGTTALVTGPGPLSVAIADLNADGWPDLVTGNSGSLATVSVLLGKGEGTFRAKTDFGGGSSPYSIAISDLNADGRLDLATANFGFDPDNISTVSVLLGNGDGTFGPKTDYAAGINPASLAITDLNEDGRPDLAVANYRSNTVSVLLGNGDGTFGAKTDFGTGDHPWSVAIADLNADGQPDLAVANSFSNTVSVLLGNGDGTFGAGTDFGTGGFGGGARAVAIADLNGDGRPDLVVTKSVLLGNGDGTFGARTDFIAGDGAPESVAIADFNADGRPDLAMAFAAVSGTVSVVLGNGDGTFGARTDYGTGSQPWSLATADLNADGRPDLAVANASSNTVSLLLSRSGPPAPVAMGFDFTPNTLSLASHGLWVTGYLEPASPFAASDIDIASIRLNGTLSVDPAAPTALGDHDGNGVPDRMVKFNRAAVELTVSEGDSVAVTVTGTVKGNKPFSGTNYIRVGRGVISDPAAGSHLTAGSVTQVRWQTPSGVTVQTVGLLHSLDGGSTWSLIARGQPNTESYDWTVPSVQTDQAKVAVLAQSAGETGDIVDGVLGVSEAFSIEAVVGVGDRGPGELALAIRGPTPNPATGGRLWVEFALRDGSPARLELVDVAGRVLSTRKVGSLGPGRHALDLSEGGALRPGIYFLRLTQGGSEVRARVAVLR